MSQLGSKPRPKTGDGIRPTPRTGTFGSVAGFRIGRGRSQAEAQRPRPTQQNGGYPPPPHQQPTQTAYRPDMPPSGQPEYFGDTRTSFGRPSGYDDAPGHTQSFAIGEAPDAYGQGSPYQQYDGGQYGAGQYDDGHVATYRAGQASAPPAGPRLHWKELLSGIALRPGQTFWQMRDYQVWGPALIVTFVYGLLAVFGFDTARKDVLNSAFSNSIPWVLSTAVAVVLSGLMMGAVTHALARQLGGDGGWAPTIGLSMLITSLTDAPRLLFAIFLGGGNGLVQVLGWATWLACGALLTSMVSKSHDLPWQKALGSASIQLIALLVLFKLPTL
ncbi:Yip1 family protein [Streptomyces sp. RB6PN23]|uniref:Yip1 family protein n=1 Tax=Streptomyces silvisoli TaxID=3034235 RepID=A0ABT5ZNP8_9ACTN|nr:Yip1 family protein [Streptomyces silvisoli]